MEKTFNFFKPEERLPEKSGAYLCNYGNNHFIELSYSGRHHAFNADDSQEYPGDAFWNVNYWAEIPEMRGRNEKRN